VISPRVWPVARTVVTIVYEGGQAMMALVTGRRLAGVRLYRDTAGGRRHEDWVSGHANGQ